MNERITTTACDTIEKGSYVVVQKVGGEHIRVMRLSSKQKVLIEKLKFDAESVFGQPYGLFEVSSGQATPVCASQVVQDEGVGDIGSPKAQPRGSTQFERSRYHGRRIGNAVHSLDLPFIVLILKPTIRLLAQSYYMKDCVRVSNLRTDQLGMILQMAAVHHGRNVLVFDQVLGLVTAGVMDRLGGQGACIHLHRGLIAQSIPCVHSMNFDEKLFSTFLPVRISSILGTTNQQENEEKEEVVQENVEAAEDSSAIRRADRLAREQRGLALLAGGVDAMIIATRTVSVPIFSAGCLATHFLFNCRSRFYFGSDVLKVAPIRLHCLCMDRTWSFQLILDAHRWLMEHDCVNVRLSDQMFRTHQVLPDRTHPLMAQHVVGGTLLSGIKVIPTDSC
ncbi:eukaryotic initiation factor 3, gamma subunit [Ostertagia ostertagi]